MKQKLSMDDVDDQVKKITQEKVLEFLHADASRRNDEEMMWLMNQAKVGMAFTRDREMTQRIQQGQVLRVINLVSTDKEEILDYIQMSVPEINIVKRLEKKAED